MLGDFIESQGLRKSKEKLLASLTLPPKKDTKFAGKAYSNTCKWVFNAGQLQAVVKS